ncbi:MAG: EAL domain-containing protein [Xanthomonadales bacterium]|nr:EAL domain-containing protein [Xanthomonadales bacterium]
MSERSLPAGALIFREGDPPDRAYLIAEGRVQILSERGPEPVVYDTLGPGEVFGEIAVLDAERRTATARALTDVRLVPIECDQLLERLEQSDPILRQLIRKLLRRYRTTVAALRGEGTPTGGGPAATEDDSAAAKISLEAALRAALTAPDQLELSLQPLLEISSGRVAGYEALIRWNHPERGAIPPDRFIRLAEETSLISAVGEFALREGCRALTILRRRGEEAFVAVNVSARQLAAEGFLEGVRRVLAETAIDRAGLKIEITESQQLDYDEVARRIDALRGLGLKIVLDDFGTGFSNLSHLHRLHFDTVKLDRSFVRAMLADPRAAAVAEAVVGVARALGADTVAEGIESEEELERVRALGVRYAQGYLIGRPRPLRSLV